MNIKKTYGDVALNNRIWQNRVNLVAGLPVSVKDKNIELAVKVGGRYYPVINVYPKKGIAEYVGFENIDLKGFDVIIPTKKDQFQAVLVGPKETYYFHTKSSCMEKHGMEQEEYYNNKVILKDNSIS